MKYQVFGKVIVGLIGLAFAGFVGLIVGLLIGHLLDRTLLKTFYFGPAENIEHIRNSFFETTFLLLGYMSKVDGRISQSETDYADQIIAQMALSAEQGQQAIALFRQGSGSAFELEPVVSAFVHSCGSQQLPQQTLLLLLISLAQAEHGIVPSEQASLVRIARLIGVDTAHLESLLRMANAQQQFQQQSPQSATSIEDAYAALGVNSSASDKEVMRAWRERISENDPDKLIANGVPEAMTKVMTGRAQEIQTAYEMIKQTRPALG
jgi:DnaJ like chaperone protein